MLIAQFGYFDLENYGDLLFPDILRNEIRKRKYTGGSVFK